MRYFGSDVLHYLVLPEKAFRAPPMDNIWRPASVRLALRPNIVLVGLTFLLIYGPKIGSVDVVAVASAGILFVAFVSGVIRQSKVAGIALGLLCGIFAYSVLVHLMLASAELHYVARGARTLLNFGGAYALVCLHYRRYGRLAPIMVMQHVFVAIAAHAVVMILQIVNADFRMTIYQWTGFPDRQGVRVPGLTISYGITNVTQGFGLLVAPFLASRLRGVFSLMFVGVFAALILGSLFLAGRTAFYMMVPMAATAWMVRYRASLLRLRSVALISLTFALVAGIYRFSGDDARTAFDTYTIRHLLEPFEARRETGTFSVATVSTVREMYFLPDDAKTLVFGSGISGRGDTYVPSDVGFVLSIFGIGMIGTSLIIVFYILMVSTALHMRRALPEFAWLSVLFTIALTVLNFKEQAYLTRHGFTVSVILFSVAALHAAKPGYRLLAEANGMASQSR